MGPTKRQCLNRNTDTDVTKYTVKCEKKQSRLCQFGHSVNLQITGKMYAIWTKRKEHETMFGITSLAPTNWLGPKFAGEVYVVCAMYVVGEIMWPTDLIWVSVRMREQKDADHIAPDLLEVYTIKPYWTPTKSYGRMHQCVWNNY